MKLLVLGAGAIGGYYGARLIEDGASVTFLVRSERRRLLDEHGLVVTSPLGDFCRQVRTVGDASVSGSFDLVLLACKGYDLASAMTAVAPAVEAGAFVLPLLNGVGIYRALDERFGRARVLGGVAQIATMVRPDGSIAHLSPLDSLVWGPRAPEAEGVSAQLLQAFTSKAGTRREAGDIVQQLWNK